jgi:glycosyltransferase involved in cell wall biosynthesis
MKPPFVSFIVPCYKLAHLLPECVNSILSQTFRDIEILIMDDCSPDNTEQVAKSFCDDRVIHIRNNPNLGHLRNYNKGISIARGKYVWLISADDYLRSNQILEKYVRVLEANPHVGYAYCSGIGVLDGIETGILDYSVYSSSDRIIRGHEFIKSLIKANIVLAASGLARKECYEKVSLFPLDMPYAGDWYLWAFFALYYDVAYFVEPMVAYRQHSLSMTTALTEKSAENCCAEDVAVPWAVKNRADKENFRHLKKCCLDSIGATYARNIVTKCYGMSRPALTLQQFERSVNEHTQKPAEKRYLRSRTYASMASDYYWQGDRTLARRFYWRALQQNFLLPDVTLKLLLLLLGPVGDFLRRRIFARVKKETAQSAFRT